MKILMALTAHFPPDSRVEKEAVSLAEAGHEVHILCYSGGKEPEFEQTPHFTIHRFRATSFFKNKLSALALVLPFYFSAWKKQMLHLHNQYHFDVYHIHDLPLSKPGYFFKKKYDARLVCDQHEFYSNWIRKTAHMNTFAGKLVSRLSAWERYERKYLNLADLVITVATPLEIRYREKYSIPEEKIITVPNTPSSSVYNPGNVKNEILEKYKDYFILFYAGGIDILRGIDTAIAALPLIRKTIPNVRLLLCGRIVKPYDPFLTAKKHDVGDLVLFEGWLDEDDLPSYIAASNVCFFTPPANREEINKTIATKIYQYAIMKKPIIVSEARMMKEYVERNRLGLSVQSDNADQFAGAVIALFMGDFVPGYSGDELLFWEDTVTPMCEKYSQLDK